MVKTPIDLKVYSIDHKKILFLIGTGFQFC